MIGAESYSLSSATDWESLAEKNLEVGLDFISRCSKADYPYNRKKWKYGIKELSRLRQRLGWYMEDRRHIFNRPITLLGFMISETN